MVDGWMVKPRLMCRGDGERVDITREDEAR